MFVYRVEGPNGEGPWGDLGPCGTGNGLGTSWCQSASSLHWHNVEYLKRTKSDGKTMIFGFLSLEQMFVYMYSHQLSEISDDLIASLGHLLTLMKNHNLAISVYETSIWESDVVGDATQCIFNKETCTFVKRFEGDSPFILHALKRHCAFHNALMSA